MEPRLCDPDLTLYAGDALSVLRELSDESVDCCVTSPPYWGLRDYGADGQIGLEATPEEYVERLVGVFSEVRRVLAPHGTVWLNLGDSYASGGRDWYENDEGGPGGRGHRQRPDTPPHLKAKDLVGVPWRVAFALQADGWWLRSDIIWSKNNPMPESVADRPTSSHEHIFLLTKAPKYYFDAEAVKEPATWERWGDQTSPKYGDRPGVKGHSIKAQTLEELDLNGRRAAGRNIRSVWTFPTKPYSEAHFAVFPPELPRRAILAGCPELVCKACGKPRERIVERIPIADTPEVSEERKELHGPTYSRHRTSIKGGQSLVGYDISNAGFTDCGHDDYRPGIVLDPFGGAGTTAVVARSLARHSLLIELSDEYCDLIATRLQQLSLLT